MRAHAKKKKKLVQFPINDLDGGEILIMLDSSKLKLFSFELWIKLKQYYYGYGK